MSLPGREKRRALAARARAERARRRHANLEFGEGPLFYDSMPMIAAAGEIVIGDGFSTYSEPITVQITAAPGARIAMGDGVGLNYGVDIYAASSIEIGDGTMVGTMVSIYDTNFHPIDQGGETKTAAVRIGSNVWLGRGALVLPGVEIGEHSVIGAGAVVSRDVPDRAVVAGNPATAVRELTASPGWRRNTEPSA